MSNVTLDNATRQHLRQLVDAALRDKLGVGPRIHDKEAERREQRTAQKRRWRERQRARRLCRCGCGERVEVARQTDKSRGHVAGEPLVYVHGHNVVQKRCEECKQKFRPISPWHVRVQRFCSERCYGRYYRRLERRRDPEKIRAYKREWARRNPDKILAKNRRYQEKVKAKKREATT